MINVVAVQAEIEYRQQQLQQEAAEQRRARLAGGPGRRGGRALRLPRFRARRPAAPAA